VHIINVSIQNLSRTLLTIILCLLALFHIIVGIGLALSVDFQQIAIQNYGSNIAWDSQKVYFIRVIGSFAFGLGLMLLQAARCPQKNPFLIISLISFFIFRNVQRYIFSDEIYQLGISESKNLWTNIGFCGLIAILIILLILSRDKNKTRS
jgi:hypothetical protein